MKEIKQAGASLHSEHSEVLHSLRSSVFISSFSVWLGYISEVIGNVHDNPELFEGVPAMNNEMLPFEECPIGMFMSDDGELCLKTEYGLEAYIVSSGERFWGGVDTSEELRHVMVRPVDVEPVRRVHENNDLTLDANTQATRDE